MENIMIHLGNMSVQGIFIVIAVLLVRAVLQQIRVPKKTISLLWFLPYFVMMVPWRIKSPLSFWKKQNVFFEENQIYQALSETQISGSVPYESALNTAVNTQPAVQPVEMTEAVGSIDFAQLILCMILIVWSVGFAVLLLHTLFSALKLRKKMICRVKFEDNIYFADDIDMPFVFGVIRPGIYLPSNLKAEELQYVLEHEKTHIMRRDPVLKITAYFITCVHWFNPFAWIAFHYMGKDMEMACDEETVRRIGTEQRKEYAETLLSLSVKQGGMMGIPLAFGEGNVKGRIKNILKAKKPMFLSGVLAGAAMIVLSIGFLTDAGQYTEQPATVEDDFKETGVTDGLTEDNSAGNMSKEDSPEVDVSGQSASDHNAVGGEISSEETSLTIEHRAGFKEPILHLYFPESVQEIGYATVGLIPEEELESRARQAMQELYDLTGTQIEECYYYAYDSGNYVFAQTQSDLEHDRCFYSHCYADEGSIATIYLASAREVWYSPVDMYALPEGYESMEESDKAIWFVTHSGLYNGQEVSYVYWPYDNMESAWRIVMKDGTVYEIWLNQEADSFSNIAGPYPDNNINH